MSLIQKSLYFQSVVWSSYLSLKRLPVQVNFCTCWWSCDTTESSTTAAKWTLRSGVKLKTSDLRLNHCQAAAEGSEHGWFYPTLWKPSRPENSNKLELKYSKCLPNVSSAGHAERFQPAKSFSRGISRKWGNALSDVSGDNWGFSLQSESSWKVCQPPVSSALLTADETTAVCGR